MFHTSITMCIPTYRKGVVFLFLPIVVSLDQIKQNSHNSRSPHAGRWTIKMNGNLRCQISIFV